MGEGHRSDTGEYEMTAEFALAVHGLVYLYHRGEMVTSEELAQNICTNPARVRA